MDQILSLSAIRDRKTALLNTINDARAQITDLEVAEQIVLRFGSKSGADLFEDAPLANGLAAPKPRRIGDIATDNPPTVTGVRLERVSARNANALTSRDLFLSILRQSDRVWFTANELQEQASVIKGRHIPMATVSPTLSKMKNDELIVRDGLKVALTDRVKKAEAPDGNTAEAPDGRGPTLPDHQPQPPMV